MRQPFPDAARRNDFAEMARARLEDVEQAVRAIA
ncbi:hypothetical protein CLV40_10497 [Actinokineospora auranticolor]|uniref:Uncharacterized protein n=1 Tax=Actinokineospora auranticolor TaxID=155976 RepID=A0A2S6GUI5_9PSEU|nr:hypothetical protein CLV40_10497 [Actinokineospora auranticolor]